MWAGHVRGAVVAVAQSSTVWVFYRLTAASAVPATAATLEAGVGEQAAASTAPVPAACCSSHPAERHQL